MTELVRKSFLLSVSRIEGQFIFQRSQNQYVSPQHLEIQIQLYFFFVTVANRLLSWFPEHCSPIASQVASLFLVGKNILGGARQLEKDQRAEFL